MAFERDPKKLFPHDYVLKYTVVPLIPQSITPNLITIFRLLGTPFVLYFLYVENYTIAVPLFLFFSFTDALDGTIARIRKQITEWGTFYDPVADKILITSVVLLIVSQLIHPYFALLIIFLEMAIISGGYFNRKKGKLVSANIFGKTKMFLQVCGVGLLLFAAWLTMPALIPYATIILSAAIVFAIVSLITYGI